MKQEKETKQNIGVQYISTPYALIKRYDLTVASVYGYIWSKQQLSKGVCCVSQETIARDLGITRQTVNTKIKMLDEDGFIKITGGGIYTDGAGRTLNIICNEDALKELDADEGIISKKRESQYHIIEGEPAKGQTISDFLIYKMRELHGEE